MSKFTVSVDDAETSLLELAHIVFHLRETTKYWEIHYGCDAKFQKKRYEKKVDDWLEKNIKKDDEENLIV